PLPGFVTRFENWDQPGFDPTQRVAFDTPAFPLESDPIRSVCVLFENMADLAPAEEEFSAFLMDLAKILARGSDNLPVERLLTVADNVRGLHEQVAEGRLDFGQQQDQILHDLNLAYRLVYLAICDLKQ
ncbi:hypothetical protein HQ520_10880, partial [bacterium]|nr:hypothetical protein [bacterium]